MILIIHITIEVFDRKNVDIISRVSRTVKFAGVRLRAPNSGRRVADIDLTIDIIRVNDM